MDKFAQSVLGAGVTAVMHPLTYAKVLIQIGYEPLDPSMGRTIFGGQQMMYPNTFKYISYIKRTDGFFGLYRGLGARLVSGILCHYVSNSVQSCLTDEPLGAGNDQPPAAGEAGDCEREEPAPAAAQQLSASEVAVKLVKDTSYETISRSVGIIVSHPFHVIFVRSCAQFVGRESMYNSVSSSISEIWNKEGIMGFFSGLVPRLAGEIMTIWLANILAQALNGLIVNTQPPNVAKECKAYSLMISQLAVTQFTYPFSVVSTVMCVNGCGLAAGSSPIQGSYSGWQDCWKQLSAEGQIKRGSGMFNRMVPKPKIS